MKQKRCLKFKVLSSSHCGACPDTHRQLCQGTLGPVRNHWNAKPINNKGDVFDGKGYEKQIVGILTKRATHPKPNRHKILLLTHHHQIRNNLETSEPRLSAPRNKTDSTPNQERRPQRRRRQTLKHNKKGFRIKWV